MPRPTKRTPEVAEILLAALAEGKTRPEALAVAGLDDNTLYRWMKADTAFRDAVEWAEVDGRFAASPILRLLEEAQRQREEAEARGRQRWEQARAGDASCLVGASPEIAEALKVAMGTHHIEYTRGKDGGWIRHVWQVAKSKRRPPLCGARTVKGLWPEFGGQRAEWVKPARKVALGLATVVRPLWSSHADSGRGLHRTDRSDT
jgi:hypothetical protein